MPRMAAVNMLVRRLVLNVGSGDAIDVRYFNIRERMSSLFEISIVGLCDNPDIDAEAVVGQPFSFTITKGPGALESRTWTGICVDLQQTVLEERGLSTYRLTLVPALWLSTQRRNYRMFQRESEPDIVKKILGEWGITPIDKLSGTYKKRKYRVQYGETDHAFLSRMLEEAGIAYYFEEQDGETKMVLHDAPHLNDARPPIPFRDSPTDADLEHVTKVRVARRMRPGKYTVRDHDYRRPPSFNLASSATSAGGVEEALERFHYMPGSFLYESDKGDATPNADDKGKYRTDEGEAVKLAKRRLEAKRAATKLISFQTDTLDLAPGVVCSLLDHLKSDVAPGKKLLVVESSFAGTNDGEWGYEVDALSADLPYRPPCVTPKPRTQGVESATVVGPPGEEIHTDEFGRVRVHFHWDRESKMDDNSSCWIHVNQPWGGTGYGGTNLPRIGQEVLVDFLGGDPDRPVVIGRVYTALQKTPYKLPDNKTQSGWKSNSTNRTGGYNEIMFEDAAGKELVNMQAEKDLNKLVKHDETVKIGNDRTKLVVHDDTHTVGHDRMRDVGNDETVNIGHDRSRTVGNDESVLVGNNRSKSIGSNESLFVGQNQSEIIGANRSKQIGENHSEVIGANSAVNIGANSSIAIGGASSETIGKTRTETVALASAETVGLAKALTIGGAYAITVGGMMATQVALVQTEIVGLSKTVTVGTKVTITCGASSITMDKDGKIVVSGKDIEIQATGQVDVNAKGDINVESAANVNVKGSLINMN